MLAAVEIDIANEFLGEPGQRAGFLVLAGLLGGFLFIRTSARLIRNPRVTWWPGNVETASGLHIHHLVWGIITIMATGFLAFSFQPPSPWMEILAVLFGVGCGLTLDEFALWLHLEDVYWAKEGRASVDAVIIAVVIGGMLVAGFAPFDSGKGGSIVLVAVAVALNLGFVLVAISKGKLLSAVLGAFVPVVAWAAAGRLAKPGSRWAKRRYAADGGRMRTAEARNKRIEAFQDRVFNLIGGAPSDDSPSGGKR